MHAVVQASAAWTRNHWHACIRERSCPGFNGHPSTPPRTPCLQLGAAPPSLPNFLCALQFGFSGDDAPVCVVPTIVGRSRISRMMGLSSRPDHYVGEAAQRMLGRTVSSHHSFPIERGVIVNWDDMERVCQAIMMHPRVQLTLTAESLKCNQKQLYSACCHACHVPSGDTPRASIPGLTCWRGLTSPHGHLSPRHEIGHSQTRFLG